MEALMIFEVMLCDLGFPKKLVGKRFAFVFNNKFQLWKNGAKTG